MPGPDKKVSFLLNGGVDNRSYPEFVSPTVAQGSSPKLITSTNTRLTVKPGTCVRAPKATLMASIGDARHGLIPSTAGKNVILSSPWAARRIYQSDSGASAGDGVDLSTEPYYSPFRITGSYALDAVPLDGVPAIAYEPTSGIMWHAYICGSISQVGTTATVFGSIVVSARSLDGKSLATPVTAESWSGVNAHGHIWVTTHGATAARVWYTDHTSGVLKVFSVSLSGRTISHGISATIVSPGTSSATMSVSALGSDNYAFIIYNTNGSATTATLARVDVTTNTVTHSAVVGTNALSGGGTCDVHVGSIGGVSRAVVACCRVSDGYVTLASYTASDLSVHKAAFTFAASTYATINVCVMDYSSTESVLVSASDDYGSFDTATNDPATRMYVVYPDNPTAWGTAYAVGTLYSRRTHGKFAVASISGGVGRVPFIATIRTYGSIYASGPGAADYVDDPCIVLYRVALPSGASSGLSPVARYGVVRGSALGADPIAMNEPTCTVAVGSSLYSVWRKQITSNSHDMPGTAPDISSGRMTVLSLSPNQPRIAHDKDGCALIAGAFPLQYDGLLMADLGCPSHKPRIDVRKNTVGSVPAAGAYSYTAVYDWTDNAGVLHRSPPANIGTVTTNGTTETIDVVVKSPEIEFSRTPSKIKIVLYGTETNGTALRSMAYRYDDDGSRSQYIFSGVSGFGGEADIYSTGTAGEELLPSAPPPLHDIAIVGQRCWGIDAEYRSRLVYSKLRIAGIGYEFNAALESVLPSGTGDAMAVRPWAGAVIAICENGVWQISGEGPNNLGVGEFAPPVKISDIGCSNTDSVIAFPGGIMWQDHERFVLMSGSGIDYMPDFACAYDVSHALLLDRYSEIVLLSSTTAEARVYNYTAKRWTTWDSQVIPAPITLAALAPYNQDRIYAYTDAGALYRIDAVSVSTAASMTWETDWILLGGDFQDHVIVRDVVLNAAITAPHSVTIEIYMDYDSTATRTQTWSSSTIDSIDKSGRYTVRLEPSEQNCRAIKLKIYDTVAGGESVRDGVAPRSVTIVYALEGLLYETAFVAGSRA